MWKYIMGYVKKSILFSFCFSVSWVLKNGKFVLYVKVKGVFNVNV